MHAEQENMEDPPRKMLENHDVLLKIVGYLPIHDWFSVEQVCSEFFLIIREVWSKQKSADLKWFIRQYFCFRHISLPETERFPCFDPEWQRKMERQFQPKALESLRTLCPNLEKIVLTGSFLRGSCDIMHPEVFSELAKFENLKTLRISGFSVNVDRLQNFLREIGQNLHEFDLRHNFLESRESAHVENLPRSSLRFFRNIKRLTVDYNTQILALRPPHTENLTEIRLFRCSRLAKAQLIDLLSDCPQLRLLEIHNCDFSTAVQVVNSVATIGTILKTLTLSHSPESLITWTHFYALLSRLTCLVELRLEPTVNVDDSSLKAIAECCRNLKSFCFDTSSITECGYEKMTELQNLQKLILPIHDPNLGKTALNSIAQITTLKSLDISTRNAFFVFEALKNHPQLRELKLDIYGKQLIPPESEISLCPSLRILKVCLGKWVLDQFVTELSKACGRVLEIFWIHGAVDITSSSLIKIGETCHQLKVFGIALGEVPQGSISVESVQRIIDSNPMLKEIHLGRKIRDVVGSHLKIPSHVFVQEAHAWREYRDVW